MTKQETLEILKDTPERVQHINLIYALQDMPYGIQGVANNMDQLAYSLGQLRQQAAAMTAHREGAKKERPDVPDPDAQS